MHGEKYINDGLGHRRHEISYSHKNINTFDHYAPAHELEGELSPLSHRLPFTFNVPWSAVHIMNVVLQISGEPAVSGVNSL